MFKSKLLLIFIRHYKKRWRYFVLFPIGAVAISILSLWTPWALRIILDEAIPEHRIDKLFLLIGSVVAVSAITMLIGSINNLLFHYGCKKALNDIRRTIIRRITRIPITQISEIGASEMLTRISGDITTFGSFISGTAMNIIMAVTVFISSITFLSYLDVRLMFACLAIIPLELISIYLFKDKVFKSSLAARNSSANVTAFIAEVLLGIPTIRSLQMDKTITSQLKYYQEEMLHTFKISQLVSLMVSLCRGVISILPMVIVFGYGGVLVIQGTLSIGSLIAFQQIVGRIYGPITSVMDIFMSAIHARVPLERMDEILGDFNYIPAASIAIKEEGGILGKTIRIKGVTFSYKNNVPILNGIDLDIPTHDTTLIVGPSGGGKTTLVKLITRAANPDGGQILFGENDLATLPDEELYQCVAMVDQDPVFFSCSIIENLLFAAPNATNQMIDKAIWAANLEEFVKQLPDGLDTKLNDRGTMISNGEMRRLALARAILRLPQILILDETTSGVEPYVERKILERIREINPEVTIIIITHRMTLVEQVNRLAFMEGGRILAIGTHQHLLAVCPSYKKLYFEEGDMIKD